MVDFVKLKDDGEKPQNKKKKYSFSFKKALMIALVFFLISSIISSISLSVSPKIAVVPIKGVIMTEKTTSIYGSSVSSRDISKILESLGADDTVKAVLIDINSPGGSPVASEEISRAIEKLREKKPVYGLINDVGASGGFWIGVSCDKLYASSMSTLGSIGVTSAGLSFEDFIVEHNISYRKQTSGEFKDMGSPFRELLEEEEEIIQNLLNEIHSNFISHVANSRNLSYEYVQKYATGEIFLGSVAKENGFIDEIGYYPEVISDLKNITGDVMILEYGPEVSFVEELGLSSIFNFNTKSQIMLE